MSESGKHEPFYSSSFAFSGARIGTARCNYENSHGKFRGQARFTDNHYGATVSNAAATGSVGFYDSGMFLGRSAVVSGIAELVSLSLPWTDFVVARYLGDPSFAPSQSSILNVAVTATPVWDGLRRADTRRRSTSTPL